MYRGGRPRRIGEEDDVPSLAFPLEEPILRARKQLASVMNDAPDVAEDDPITGVKLIKRIHAGAMACVRPAGKPP